MINNNLDYRSILLDFSIKKKETCEKTKTFLSTSTIKKKYLLGRNEHSLALAQLVKIDGYVDDYVKNGNTWHGMPVIKISELSTNSVVINCSMSISPVTAMKRLFASKSASVLNYADLLREEPNLIPMPDFIQTTRLDFVENESRFIGLYASLADERSRIVMKNIFGYRLTGDPIYMQDFHVRFSDQYFEGFLNLKDAVFIDAGGFDGDTTEEFCKRYPTYKKILLFEPSLVNIKAAKNRLGNQRDIEYIQLGLSDSVGSLWFNPDAGSASAMALDGIERIEVTTIDDFTNECVTFIKMDLEGWELKALHGSCCHIREDHPALAISVYHHPSDFWRIYEYVMSIRDDYKIYLRHYTEGWSETILFFVPI